MTSYLITGASILGGEPTDLLLQDGASSGSTATGATPGARGRSTPPG